MNDVGRTTGDERPTGRVTTTRQSRIDADVRVRLDGRPPSELLTELGWADGMIDALGQAVARAVAALPDGRPTHHVRHLLREAGVTAMDGLYADVAATTIDPSVVRGEADPTELIEATAAFGDATPGPGGVRYPFEAWFDGPAALLEATNVGLQVTVKVTEAFREQRREHRTRICRVLGALARVGSVEIVASRLTQQWLAHSHREDLPGVHEACSAGGNAGCKSLAEAATEFSVSDRPVRTLEAIARAPGETLGYDALTNAVAVSRATVRSHIHRLAEYDLVESFGQQSERKVELTSQGREFLETEIATQRRLSEGVVRDQHKTDNNRVSQRKDGRGDPEGEQRSNRSGATTQWVDRDTHVATAAVADAGTVTCVDYPVEQWPRDARGWPEPRLSVNQERDEAIVGVDVQGPLQLVTSTALALWDPKARTTLWTGDRLDALGDALGENKAVLRDIRTLGWVSDDVTTAEEFVEELGEAAQRLRGLTTKYGQGDESDSSLRGEIMQLAHGMIGVATQVADLCEIDLTYLYQFPAYSRDWAGGSKWERRQEVAETLARSIVIQSAYQGHTAYRHLCETRPAKREQAFSVQVDASDPTGDLLSSIVLVGDGVTAFREDLREQLQARELHEDAPEFAIEVPIRTEARHGAWRETAERAAGTKNMTVRGAAVKVLRALVATPFDLADGIIRDGRLASEGVTRELRSDEVRRILRGVSTDRLVPEHPPSVGKIIQALAAAERAIPTEVVIEGAGISRASFRRYVEVLAGLDLVADTGGETSRWRLRIAFPDEQGAVYPRAVTEWSRRDVLLGLAHGTIPTERLSDTEHPVMKHLLGMDPPGVSVLEREWTGLREWGDVVRSLVGVDPPGASEPEKGRVGRVAQTSLSSSGHSERSVAD